MKKQLFSLIMILMLSATLTNAQRTENTGMSFGILGGINFQNLNGDDMFGDKLDYDILMGFHLGVNVQIPIVPEFYFQPGLLFSTKGAKTSFTLLGVEITNKIKLNYIELPLNFVYKGKLGNGYVFLGFGPYLGYAVSGKLITEGGSLSNDTKIKFKNTVEVGDSIDIYFKALDVGANIFAGYEMSFGVFLQLNTQFGLLKINPEYKAIPDDKSSVKNTGFGISIGYRL